MATISSSRALPSARWTSFDGWDYNGMKECLESLLANLDKSALVRHAELIMGQKLTMSDPFSAGQYWICFEMIADNGNLVIARVRLPRHPDTPTTVSKEDELCSVACEVATMNFVRQRVPSVRVPTVYAYEGPGSQAAAQVGAIYMLLEGFYGNTLQDIQFDMCKLPDSTQEHIITQWATVQAELATLAYPHIGSISSLSETGEPIIGKLSVAFPGCVSRGPFSSVVEYFMAIAEAVVNSTRQSAMDPISFARLGAFVFMDIVQQTKFFQTQEARFPFNHMDRGTQNILVDNNFNFLAIIDWEMAHTAPWQVNYFPMPFPLICPDTEIDGILKDPSHIAHTNILRQTAAQQMYVCKFRDAETELRKKGQPLDLSFADILNSTASRIYACFSRLGDLPESDENHVREMVRLAFGFDAEKTSRYLDDIKDKVQ